jgi:hypothetical protein
MAMVWGTFHAVQTQGFSDIKKKKSHKNGKKIPEVIFLNFT